MSSSRATLNSIGLNAAVAAAIVTDGAARISGSAHFHGTRGQGVGHRDATYVLTSCFSGCRVEPQQPRRCQLASRRAL